MKFKGKKIVIIGDVMLDKYIEGEVTRISPEAPVPIVKVEKEFYEVGGAGNVATNIASLGGSAFLFSFLGNDAAGQKVKEILKSKSVSFLFDESQSTIEKTRVIGKSQQLIRFDKEDIKPRVFSNLTKKAILEKVKESGIIIISDYAKGTVTQDVMNLLEEYKSKIIIDPRPQNKSLYKGVFLITPNEKECFEMSSCKDVFQGGDLLQKELSSHILVTRGEKGMAIFAENIVEIPTYAKEVYDVTGAGDTVIAALSLSLASGASLEEGAILANHAAGIAVAKKGTYNVTFKELKEKITIEGKKVVDLEELKRIVEEQKRKGRKIVWTNGCFDILHIGHIKYLQEAKKLGDILIVGINSDESVKKLKGPERPLQSEKERAEILSALDCVDYITIFPDITSTSLLGELQPNIYVKGADYTKESMNQDERKAIMDYNGNIIFIPLVEGKSTSNIIQKLRSD
ncbi:MAG: D-glycero-beta-D-manno-heptose 1-phosphate adenylyltransferase [Nanoarchaeota archaeon]|nr:D-glycero-beta-D-manno-heptose 1-phosphate adenylyltransferase [Nanoarchaeota archaeon]